ncbi:MarR family winged helix-turn-helix transcriptional regulator [Amycolatopsis xylanica]|nr:MarR family transcriptional regulator [Amycolatopsis xylanica]
MDDVEETPLLEDQMCFSLYAASRAVTALYRPLLKELEITYPQYLVMLTLWEHGDRGVTEIGDALSLDSGTLSPLLKRLEKLGLVRRERRSDDERSVRVTLTEEGDALRAKATHVPGVVSEAMGLPPVRFAQLQATLRELTRSVNAYRQTL